MNANTAADALAANAAAAVASNPWVKAAGGGTLVVAASINASSAAGPLGAGRQSGLACVARWTDLTLVC